METAVRFFNGPVNGTPGMKPSSLGRVTVCVPDYVPRGLLMMLKCPRIDFVDDCDDQGSVSARADDYQLALGGQHWWHLGCH